MTEPLISVVIPTYNYGRFVAAAVESALSQTYSHLEVLVVDDGSTDDTRQRLTPYLDRIRYIRRENGGVAAAHNTGLAHARGRCVKFLDADDSLHPEQIAWQTEALAGREDAVSLTAVRLYRDGRPEEFIDHVPRATALLPDLFRDIDWGGTHGWLFPTALVRAAGGFDETLGFAEDWDFFARLGMLDPVLATDARVGCYYRLRAGSMSANRAGMTTARGRALVKLHDQLRQVNRSGWFGIDLLKAEQVTYQGLVQLGVNDGPLLEGLLRRIFELQKRVGFGQYGWRFRLMARTLGYARAERLRSFVVRALKIRPPQSLDIQEWRYAT